MGRWGDGESIILRCYECHGEVANFNLKGDLELEIVGEVNCLEENIKGEVDTFIEPWKVKTFKLIMVNSTAPFT